MRLTKNEFLSHLFTYRQMCEEEEKIVNALDIGFDSILSNWINNYYNFIHDLCELREGEYGSTLDWWCFETNFGKNDAVIETDNETFKIHSAAALYDYLVNVEIPSYGKEPTNGTNFFN